MKCQICKKNDARIVFTQIVNNEKMVLHICPECAREKGLSIEIDISPAAHDSHSVEKLLKGFTSQNDLPEDEGEQGGDYPDLTCETCGLTFRDFKKEGLFGCDSCHVTFSDYLEDILRQIHGTAVHDSEPPKTDENVVGARHELKRLREKLKHCVEIENYEEAAEIRDRIAEIQKEKDIS